MVEKVNVELSPNATPEEVKAHEEAMTKLADENQGNLTIKDKDGNVVEVKPQGEPTGEQKVERPADIPEKFWDAEKGEVNIAALLKSQQDGEVALRAGKPEVKPEPKEGEEGYVKPEDKSEAKPEVVANASKEYAEKGELTAETYTALEAQGMDRAMVDEYITGQKAIVAGLEAAAASPFEGDFTKYNAAADWAAEKLTDDEIKAFDIQLTSTNPAIVAQGAKALAAKYAAEADIAPDVTIHGDGSTNQGGTSFKSSAEMQAAMSDPRYKNDESYRQEVAAKIGRSPDTLF